LIVHFTIADCVAANALAFPGRVALELLDPAAVPRRAATDPVGSWTYDEVWRRVCGLAAPLQGHRMVAILLPNVPDHALAYLACQVAGAAAVPVNNRLAAPEVEYVLRDSGATLLLSGDGLLGLAREVADPLGVPVVDVASLPTPGSGAAETVWAGPGGPEAGQRMAIVGYTSGTTGFPKGSFWSNAGLMTRLLQWGWTFGMTPEQVLSVPGPLFHLSYGGLTLGALAVGAKARIMASFDPGAALEEYTSHATWVFLVPSMLAMIAEAWRERGRPPASALQLMLSSGAPGPMSLLEEAFDVFPNARITEAYGWTEGGWVTFEVKDRAALVPHSVGWPLIGSEVAVVDPEDPARRCAVGEPGEVLARTIVPFEGYLSKPEATAAAVTPDGFVRSGDVGIWLPDGRLTIVDRVKDMIISGGENVYCAEVERILHEHPGVLEAAVVGLPDPTWGERVTAVVVAREGATLDPQEVVTFSRERLAAYKCPKDVIVRRELPRNPMGKVQKFRIVEELAGS
jgi:acyl-CoA synthetase (AMP-forming)/AMP-acid ligase II